MAHRALREYDAKMLWADRSGQEYPGILITGANKEHMTTSTADDAASRRVVKPDQLFGQRAQHGLIGLDLSRSQTQEWIQQHREQSLMIDGVRGVVDTFLLEPFVPHERERYLAYMTTPDADRILFSSSGGTDIEADWEQVTHLDVPVLEELELTALQQAFGDLPPAVMTHIQEMFTFFRKRELVFLEVNPLVLDADGQVVCLDMVAKVDSCAIWKTPEVWEESVWSSAFGAITSSFAQEVAAIDAHTGASVKYRLLEPEGRIGLVLGSGGGSMVVLDMLTEQGLLSEVINYGELSGNPTYRHNKTYVQGVLDAVLASPHTGQKYLCYLGPIANFTDIGVMGKAWVDAMKERLEEIQEQHIKLIVRRGGINAATGLEHIRAFCMTHKIDHEVLDASTSLAEAVGMIE